MNVDLQDQLRRLGLGQGASAIRPPEQRRTAIKIEKLIPGRIISHQDRRCFIAEERYPLAHPHGRQPLGALLDVSTELVETMVQEPGLARLSFRQFLFIDTETTGLSGGSGTIAFLVGAGFYDGDAFVMRQYFLRNPGEEPAMLADLADLVARYPAVVSFNGRSFDLPLLEGRYILNRQRSPFLTSPHLDLLHPARRLWRERLESCRLVALEGEVLEVQRDQADVPSSVIPLIYRDYLRTGNAIEMPRIFYHNRIDVLSMVTLATHLGQFFAQPEAAVEHPLEWLALGRWYEGLGMVSRAEWAYRQALAEPSALQLAYFEAALWRLGLLLKRAERRVEAAEVWQQLAVIEMDDVRGHVELAKHHEWQVSDLAQAAEWTQRALGLVERWPKGLRTLVQPELEHRFARLERKLAQGGDSET